MTIIRAGAAHPFVLAAIHAAAFPDNEAWSVMMFAAQLGQPGVLALLEEDGGLIVMRMAADEAEILTLGVAPDARRRGVGRALVEAGCGAARDADAVKVFLEVAAGNAAARALYQGCGFSEIGIRRRYYADGGDALLMARIFGPRQGTDRAAGSTPL
jgi:ribosomal-protein-alanine N-acetyltransferase